MSSSSPSAIHPVLTLINSCDSLAQQFDTTFAASCTLLTNLANNTPAPGAPTNMDVTLMSLRGTLEQCEGIVGNMLNCIYADIPHLLDSLDGEGGTGAMVGNWNPKQALDDISRLFYVRISHSETNTKFRKLLLTTPSLTPRPSPPTHRKCSLIKSCSWRKENCWQILHAKKSHLKNLSQVGHRLMEIWPARGSNRLMTWPTYWPLSNHVVDVQYLP